MKKYLLLAIVAFGLFAFKPAEASAKTLYQCYKEKGMTLGSVSQRAVVAAENGIWKYKGTAVQNIELTKSLCSDLFGFSVATGYQKTLRVGASASQDFFQVSSLLLKDGTALNMTTLGGKVFLTLEPGATKEEIVMCTGINTTTIQFTGCTRGLAFSGTSTASVPTLAYTHNASSIIVMSNVHYVYEQYIDINVKDQIVNGNKTINGIWTFGQTPFSTTTFATDPAQLITLGQLASTSFSGCVNASESVRGCGQVATDAQYLAGTATSAPGVYLWANPSSTLAHMDEQIGNNIAYNGSVTALQVLKTSGGQYAVATGGTNDDQITAIAFESGTSGQFRRVWLPGSYVTSGLFSFSAGSFVYVDSPTGFPTTIPSPTRKVIGIALSSNSFFFEPSYQTPQYNAASSTAYQVPMTDASSTLRGWSGAFGGDGTNGALSVTSGTTTIDLLATNIVVRQYTSINILAGAVLTFSNPPSDGSMVILKSRSSCNIAGTINGSGFGAATSTRAFGLMETLQAYNAAVSNPNSEYGSSAAKLWAGKTGLAMGSGGQNVATASTSGRGGVALRIECADSLVFTGTINVNGQTGLAGAAATNVSAGARGGGAGGAGGSFLGLANRIITNSGSITFAGGLGGAGGNGFCGSLGSADGGGQAGAIGGGGFLSAGGAAGAGGGGGGGFNYATCSAAGGAAGGASNGAAGSAAGAGTIGGGAGAFFYGGAGGGGGAGSGGFGTWLQNYWYN